VFGNVARVWQVCVRTSVRYSQGTGFWFFGACSDHCSATYIRYYCGPNIENPLQGTGFDFRVRVRSDHCSVKILIKALTLNPVDLGMAPTWLTLKSALLGWTTVLTLNPPY
jgi:hypothetical protein